MAEPESKKKAVFLTGRCTCGHIRYQLTNTPLFVHCCHCTWCQRETGSAFVLNALIETSHFILMPSVSSKSISTPTPSAKGKVEQGTGNEGGIDEKPDILKVDTPSASGKGQVIMRCPKCFVAVWSEYGGVPIVKFVRVGTLDKPGQCAPSIHIYTETKQSWVKLNDDVSVYEAYYDRNKEWPKESLERREKLRPEIERFLRL